MSIILLLLLFLLSFTSCLEKDDPNKQVAVSFENIPNQLDSNPYLTIGTSVKKIPSTTIKKLDIDTVHWVDTIINGKFIHLYSSSKDDYADIYATWGNAQNQQQYNFQSDTTLHWLSPPFSTAISWISPKSFCFALGCGQTCMYGLIFHVEKPQPILIDPPLAFYPNMPFLEFTTDHPDLYITTGDLSIPEILVRSADTGLNDTIRLHQDWIRGMGLVYHIIDEVRIKDGELVILQREGDEVVRE